MNFQKSKLPVVLIVLDGWGIAPEGTGNAITEAKPPNMFSFWSSFPHTQLEAAGEAVGLPPGEDGNSETGHLNLGAGKIVYQYLARINMSIANGSFFENPVLVGAIEHARKNNSNLHLMGLIGSGNVHSSIEHLFALIHLANKRNFKNLFIHAFTDGRDSPPNVASIYLQRIEEVIKNEGVGQIASIMGRYWAMDRDKRWDRTAKAYFALTEGIGYKVISVYEAIHDSYAKGITDEFIEPYLVVNNQKKPIALIKDNDAVIFFNFRIDRPRQLVRSFVLPNLIEGGKVWGFDPYLELYSKKHTDGKERFETPSFKRPRKLKNLYFAMMTEYEEPLLMVGAKAAFFPQIVEMPISRVISTSGIKQLKVAESEKERFVTYYFNGRREMPFPNEDWVIVPSPKVSTYDLKPEMASKEITEAFLEKMSSENYGFALINFASPDMVSHSGNIEATKKAVIAVDACLGKISKFILDCGGTLLITADHGNAEEMINLETNQIDTEHSKKPVPFIAISQKYQSKPLTLQSGILADVAPTVLSLMNLEIPPTMIGRDLLKDIQD